MCFAARFANIKVTRESKLEARENSRAGCRVKSTFFAIWLCKLAYYQENHPALVIELIKNAYKMFWATLLMPK